MLEIKIRIRAIDERLQKGAGKLSLLDAEFCFLQARKIIEQICFSSILCDERRYRDFRTLEGETNEEERGDYEADWNARIILNKLRDISPHFMPIPIGKRTSTQNIHHFERRDVNATHTKLIRMYKKCGSFMHIPKPFGEDYESHIERQRQKHKGASETIKGYSKYFKELLWNHAAIGLEYEADGDKLKSLDAGNPRTAWLVHFGEYGSNDISITVGLAE